MIAQRFEIARSVVRRNANSVRGGLKGSIGPANEGWVPGHRLFQAERRDFGGYTPACVETCSQSHFGRWAFATVGILEVDCRVSCVEGAFL
jgi:hypothetical protein